MLIKVGLVRSLTSIILRRAPDCSATNAVLPSAERVIETAPDKVLLDTLRLPEREGLARLLTSKIFRPLDPLAINAVLPSAERATSYT